MSGAGGYLITNNEGRLDQLILGTDLLKERLSYAKQVRANMIAKGQLDPSESQPSLGDIEQTHLIFVHAIFKSYVSIAYEYYKINPQGGAPALRATNTSPADFLIPQYGDFISDAVVHAIVTFPTLSGTNASDFNIRACDHFGLRFLQYVGLSINSNTLDEYDETTALFNKQFGLTPGKESAFNRCIGQEEVMLVPQTSDSQYAMNGSAAGARMWASFSNGPQTPQPSGRSDKIEVFIPLALFTQDVKLALPTVCLPSSHRYFKTQVAPVNMLFGVAPSSATPSGSDVSLSIPTVEAFEMYLNNIFIHDDVHDIYVDRIGFNLIRIHKSQDFNVTDSTGNLQLSQFKFPTETIFIGCRPNANLNANHNSGSKWEDQFLTQWYRFNAVSYTTTQVNAHNGGGTPADYPVVGLKFNVPTYTPTLGNITILSQGVILYNAFPSGFYGSYIPYQYGSINVSAPKVGEGALMIPFNFYPGSYQPSGYVNVSRSREFFIQYTSSYISTSNPCTMLARSVAINFVVINDGNAYLRYLT